MRRHQLVDSSLDEYKLTDLGTEYHSGSETEPTDVDDDMDEVIEDVQDVEGLIDCADPANELHLPEYYLKQMEEFDKSKFCDGSSHVCSSCCRNP